MGIGVSVFLIAIGAILAYAVSADVEGVNLQTIGTILMIVGAIGLIVSLMWAFAARRRDVVHHDDRYAGPPPATY